MGEHSPDKTETKDRNLHRLPKTRECRSTKYTPIAQLNRAADYESAG